MWNICSRISVTSSSSSIAISVVVYHFALFLITNNIHFIYYYLEFFINSGFFVTFVFTAIEIAICLIDFFFNKNTKRKEKRTEGKKIVNSFTWNFSSTSFFRFYFFFGSYIFLYFHMCTCTECTYAYRIVYHLSSIRQLITIIIVFLIVVTGTNDKEEERKKTKR